MGFLKILKSAHRQRGLTLVDLLVGLAITGLLASGITAAISQVLTVNSASMSRMIAIKQIESAIDTIRPDVIAAQNITPGTSAGNGFILTLNRINWHDNSLLEIAYYVDSEKNELIRSETGNSTGENITSEEVIASNIASLSMQDWEYYSGGKITLTLVAVVNSSRSATETRTFDIFPRPAR